MIGIALAMACGSMMNVESVYAALPNQDAAQKELEFSRTFDVKDFTELEISSIFQVTFVQGKTYAVTGSSNRKELLDQVKAENHNGKLTVQLDGSTGNLPGKNLLEITITAPSLNRVKIAGGASFSCEKLQTKGLEVNGSGIVKISFTTLQCEELGVKVSGGAKLDMGTVKAQSLDLDASGIVQAKGVFNLSEDAEVKMSGSSSSTVEIKAGKIEFSTTGTARMNAKVECKSLEAKSTGVGRITLTGTADNVQFSTDGNSNINAKGLNRF